ncbi:hypothetical protein [Streptomyces sp. NBRC 110465]|uniref:hypothetical protein n=1 Tax=Streptomyces sp. NBRC 110465 TaxID=1897621 RepID=UPI0011612879|nr:hypothetical protein [Streptomyces sp. NBRC 110465]
MAIGAETAIAGLVAVLYSLQSESHGGEGGLGWLFGTIFALVLLAVTSMIAGLAGSAMTVLPLVLLGRAAARRTGRRDSWQLTLATVAVVAAALALLIGSCMLLAGLGGLLVYPVLALSLIAGLAPATLCARAAGNPGKPGARWRVLGGVALGGLGLLAVTLAVGGAAYSAGILKIYEPPRLTEADMAGTWTDGDGGSLRFEADGTVTAKGVNEYEATGEQSGAVNCTGTWQLTRNDSVGRPFELSIADCESLSVGWDIGGTEDHPTVFTWIGDPDSGERYILTRQR